MENIPEDLLRRFLCFSIAWRIVNPEAQDSIITRAQILLDAERIGLFEQSFSSPPVTEETIRTFRGVISEWEDLYPNHPEYREYLQSLLDSLIADIQSEGHQH
jgi:hypothetical protein